MSAKRLNGAGFTAVVMLAVLGYVTWRLYAARQQLQAERDDHRRVSVTLSTVRSERDELIRVLNRLVLPGPFLEGNDVNSGQSVSLTKPADGVYYLIRVTCPFCGANDSALKVISDAGAAIFILAIDSDLPSLSIWLKDHQPPAVRAFTDVRGTLMNRLPTEAVPRTFVVRNGQVKVLVTGRLDSTAVRTVLDSALSR